MWKLDENQKQPQEKKKLNEQLIVFSWQIKDDWQLARYEKQKQ